MRLGRGLAFAFAFAFAAAAVSAHASAHARAQDRDRSRTVFRADSLVVYVDVLVERDGRALTDLSLEDFVILDEGEPRPLTSFARDHVPLELVLALDTSSSMAGARLQYLQNASRAVIDALEPDDSASILSFSHHTSLRQPTTSEHGALLAALESLSAYGETAWRDALFTSLAMTGRVGRRQVVMLFTDGDDTYSWLSDEAILEATEQANALVYAVTSPAPGFTTGARTRREQEALRAQRAVYSRRVRSLRDITRATGARLLEMDAGADLQSTFLEILHESSVRYLLGFAPASPVRPGWHELRVEITNQRRGVDVHARRGYYFEP